MVKFMDNQNSGFNSWMANRQNNKSNEKKSPLAGALWWGILIFLAYFLIFGFGGDKKEVVQNTNDTANVESIDNVPMSKIENADMSATVQGLRIYDFELKNYKSDADEKINIELLADDKNFTEIGFLGNGVAAPTAKTVWKVVDTENVKIMTWENEDNIQFTRTILMQDYVISVSDEIKNNSKVAASFVPYARINYTTQSDKSVAVSTGGFAFENGGMSEHDWKDLEKSSYAYQTTSGFIGFAEQYWEAIISLDSADQTIRLKSENGVFQADTNAGIINVGAGEVKTVKTNVFAGPRDQQVLADAAKYIPNIEETMDYGWFGFLSRPMLSALNFLHGFVLNYGIAIILLTLVLRLLMWPLTKKSYTSMAAMQKMQPEMKKIQKLYGNDKARLQMEMMKLYQTHKTSPMSGCLPMLLQIPIFFALYKALLISVPMRQADFLWISDLAVMDPYFILPILMGLTMWWQQNLQTQSTPNDNPNDPMAQTQRIMKWMPVLFTVIFAWMPAGLVLYWAVSNLFGIGQMYVIKKTMKK